MPVWALPFRLGLSFIVCEGIGILAVGVMVYVGCRHAEGLSFVEPRAELGLAGSFLQMLDNAEPNPTLVRVR